MIVVPSASSVASISIEIVPASGTARTTVTKLSDRSEQSAASRSANGLPIKIPPFSGTPL